MISLRAFGLIALMGITMVIVACSSERGDWRSAQSADTIESYGRFLSDHPEGELAADARTRIAQLAEERDWTRAVQVDTASAYERFLSQHPDGRWAQEARIRAETFVLSESPPRVRTDAFNVQLGAFATERSAREEWQRLLERFQGELHGLSGEVAVADIATGTLYRLQARVPDEAAARELCGALARQGQACVVVLPNEE